MGHEGGEQVASVTPIIDSILEKLPPMALKLSLSAMLSVAEQAKNRLLEKLKNGDLTQKDIEQELGNLPDVGGIEDGKVMIVDTIRFNCPNHNVKELPVE